MTGRRQTNTTMVTKPSRSDDVLDATQQLLIYNQVRSQFDSLAPKRPIKPNRSEPVDSLSTTIAAPDERAFDLPELHKLRSLQAQSRAVFSETALPEQDEFVETEYYKALDSIDKQHHTTGSGFIKAGVDHKAINGYEVEVNNEKQTETLLFKSNPATNDWIPKFEEHQGGFVSSKPNRSESS